MSSVSWFFFGVLGVVLAIGTRADEITKIKKNDKN